MKARRLNEKKKEGVSSKDCADRGKILRMMKRSPSCGFVLRAGALCRALKMERGCRKKKRKSSAALCILLQKGRAWRGEKVRGDGGKERRANVWLVPWTRSRGETD